MCFPGDRNRKSSNSDDATNQTNDPDMDKLVANIEDFKRNFSSVTKSIFNITNESLSQFNDIAKDYSFNWLFDLDRDTDTTTEDFRKSFKDFLAKDGDSPFEESQDKEFEYPSQYEVRNSYSKAVGAGDNVSVNPFIGGGFRDFFHGNFRSGKSPFGYYSYKAPSIRYYNQCVNKGGESVWDAKGYWRCLFPNSEIPVELLNYKQEKLSDRILTKEDLNNAIQEKGVNSKDGVIDLGEKGVFFHKFEDYLNWKSIMYDNVKKDRIRRRGHWKKKLEDAKDKLLVQDNNNAKEPVKQPVKEFVNEPSTEKKVTSTVVSSHFHTNPNTNEVEFNEIRKEYFTDGTSLTRRIKKSKPVEADDWVNINETIESGGVKKALSSAAPAPAPTTTPATNESSGGWFWNSGKK
ncbi:uncharacterized protein RJT21DRAFT_44743 [Scheffersomyces amazonensis]|uniref:uncharacterized protein n=1 Tax=Scheffersomyces amazonensis TaxID=1078765 RepID=UPI00315D6E8D